MIISRTNFTYCELMKENNCKEEVGYKERRARKSWTIKNMGSYLFAGAFLFFLILPCMADRSVGAGFYDDDDNNRCDYDGNCASLMEIINVKKRGSSGTSFYCSAVDPGTTTDVNKLSPFHVGVVAALGDSMTAAVGAGASSFFSNFVEYKGISWSIGGKSSLSKVTTLPNILKLFNRRVYGYSVDTKILKSKEALNRAVSGDKIKDLLTQAKDLVRKMQRKRQQTQNKWKVITIWIGNNDLCLKSTCTNSILTTVKKFMNHLHAAMSYLYRNVRRAFINLVLPIDVSILAPIKELGCNLVHSFVCECGTRINPAKASRVQKAINSQINKEFVYEQPYERQDFTVVVQPMFASTSLLNANGRPDKSYLAPDCFHFSQKAHTMAATYLWNNMLQPVGKKTDGIIWGRTRQLMCPNPDFPYFRTNQNSKRG